ncbi:MAG: hypothetical protein H6Q31_3262, partial [Bacteroidetes bacterium]|nr:hypothetical protein [Bacteroidota bacterium]
VAVFESDTADSVAGAYSFAEADSLAEAN